MVSEIIKRVENIDRHAKEDPLDPKLLEAYVIATDVCLNTEKDIPYGLSVSKKAKPTKLGRSL